MTVTNHASGDGADRDGRDHVAAAAATLAVLEGAVAVRDAAAAADDVAVKLVSGESLDVFGEHAVTTVSATPSCYVYVAAGTTQPPSAEAAMSNDGRERPRPGCSNACYAFALDAIQTAFSALFSA